MDTALKTLLNRTKKENPKNLFNTEIDEINKKAMLAAYKDKVAETGEVNPDLEDWREFNQLVKNALHNERR